MADVEVYAAELEGTTVKALTVRFKGTAARTISRDTALHWLRQGHSLVTHAGGAHHPVRGHAIERVEVDGESFLRTDVKPEPADHVAFPGAGH